jgi:hypothetical protein
VVELADGAACTKTGGRRLDAIVERPMLTKTAVAIGAITGVLAGGAVAWLVQRTSSRVAVQSVIPGSQLSDQPAKARATPAAVYADFDNDPVLRRVVRSGPMARSRDAFRVIVRPKYVPVAEVTYAMSDDEIVLGLEVANQCRAYPINYLNDHELVRDEIGGLPLLVTW